MISAAYAAILRKLVKAQDVRHIPVLRTKTAGLEVRWVLLAKVCSNHGFVCVFYDRKLRVVDTSCWNMSGKAWQ